jgi:hypothetical protein
MTINIASDVKTEVVIRFTVTDDLGNEYNDALRFSPAEHAVLSEKEISDVQEARFTNWKAIVSAPPRELTPEEAQKKIAAIEENIAAMVAQKTDLQLTAGIAVEPIAVEVK